MTDNKSSLNQASGARVCVGERSIERTRADRTAHGGHRHTSHDTLWRETDKYNNIGRVLRLLLRWIAPRVSTLGIPTEVQLDLPCGANEKMVFGVLESSGEMHKRCKSEKGGLGVWSVCTNRALLRASQSMMSISEPWLTSRKSSSW